mmetsp:Transcript_44354/g.128339  ORF Transcript_44354/g.128339 Transcript_44354/m.128339 type:complete len:214 (-) Transcript_44354:542-1183(-)
MRGLRPRLPLGRLPLELPRQPRELGVRAPLPGGLRARGCVRARHRRLALATALRLGELFPGHAVPAGAERHGGPGHGHRWRHPPRLLGREALPHPDEHRQLPCLHHDPLPHDDGGGRRHTRAEEGAGAPAVHQGLHDAAPGAHDAAGQGPELPQALLQHGGAPHGAGPPARARAAAPPAGRGAERGAARARAGAPRLLRGHVATSTSTPEPTG